MLQKHAEAVENLRPVGIYRGLSFADYAADPGYNHSKLKTQKRSLEHLALELSVGRAVKDSAEMRLGRVFHTLVEQRGSYADIPRIPILNLKSSKDREIRDQFILDVGRDYYGEDEKIILDGMYAALMAHEAGAAFLSGIKPEDHEVSIFWVDELSGVRCKARLDLLDHHTFWAIGDIKTTSNSSEEEFSRTIFSYGYYSAAAFYLNAVQQHYPQIDKFILLAVETTPPHLARVYTLHPDAIAKGQAEFRAYISEYARACETQNWKSPSKRFEAINIPHWAYKK